MEYNNDDYLTYKKNKLHNSPRAQKRPISKLSFLLQLFVATFIIMFILIALSIMKFQTKVDIEYSRNDISRLDSSDSQEDFSDEVNSKIDKRLVLIQQEENAPNEAKVILDESEKSAVIDPGLIEENRKIDKKHTQEFKKMQEEKQKQKVLDDEIYEKIQPPKPIIPNLAQEIKAIPKQEPPRPQVQNTSQNLSNDNITIMSKVLIGRYPTLEEAQAAQSAIKANNPALSPYVKKVGKVFAIQMGSYQDFNVARRFAQTLSAKGYDVWIYQQ